jgi:predicted phage terminase large subunit-like protein
MNGDAEAFREAIGQAKARKSLIEFSRRCVPGFQAARHLVYIAGLLERIERGELRNLIVTLHPGAGKSTLLQAFAAWYLGRDSRRKIIGASAGAELAERNSRASRGLFSEATWPFEAQISKQSAAMARWNTTVGGGMFAIGVDGKVTGWRANLIIGDDLQNDAGSRAERDSLWTWFTEILTPRLEPGGSKIIIGTRWSEDDIVARIEESPEADEWEIVRLPAFAEAEDPMERDLGASLWPERWPVEALERVRTSMGSRSFATQFQADPVPSEGNLVRTAWFENRYDRAPEAFVKVEMGLDSAAQTGVSNDFTCIATVGITKSEFYILNMEKRKVEFPGLLQMTVAANEQTKPRAIYVEDTSNATALIQALKAESHLPIVPIKAVKSKIARVEGVTGLMEAGKVRLPREAPWLVDFERELFAFPNSKHDDMVDALVLVLSQHVAKQSTWRSFTFGAGYMSPITYEGDEESAHDDDGAYGVPTNYSGVTNAIRTIFGGGR